MKYPNGKRPTYWRMAFTATTVLFTTWAQAHGLWFAQRSGEIALIYGEGGDDLDMAARLPLLHHMAAYDTKGRPVPTAIKAQDKLAVVDMSARPAVLAAVLDNGIWTKTADGLWHKKAKHELSDVVHSSRNFKYAVHLVHHTTTPIAVLPKQTLQLVPLSPIPETRGTLLRLRVLFDGKPLAGAKVTPDLVGDPDAPQLISDANGEVELLVRNQGLNVIAAETESPPQDHRLADSVGHIATLSFRLSHAAE